MHSSSPSCGDSFTPERDPAATGGGAPCSFTGCVSEAAGSAPGGCGGTRSSGACQRAVEEPVAATAASPAASSGAKLSCGLVRTAGRSGEEGARRDQTTALLARITFPPSYQVPSLPSSTNKIYTHLSKCKQGFKGQLCPHWPTGITSKNTNYPKRNIFA